MSKQPLRSERLIPFGPENWVELIKGIRLCPFASGNSGAIGLSTGFAILSPGARLPYHTHPTSEAITVVQGLLKVSVEGRTYHLSPFDCIHVPAKIAHSVASLNDAQDTIVLTAFPTGEISRDLVSDEFTVQDRSQLLPRPEDPETLARFSQVVESKPFSNTYGRELFRSRPGAETICGGYLRIEPGATVPSQTFAHDETSTLVGGQATCVLASSKYSLGRFWSVFIDSGC